MAFNFRTYSQFSSTPPKPSGHPAPTKKSWLLASVYNSQFHPYFQGPNLPNHSSPLPAAHSSHRLLGTFTAPANFATNAVVTDENSPENITPVYTDPGPNDVGEASEELTKTSSRDENSGADAIDADNDHALLAKQYLYFDPLLDRAHHLLLCLNRGRSGYTFFRFQVFFSLIC